MALDNLIECDKYHPALCFTLPLFSFKINKKIITVKKNFRRANYVAINEYLGRIPWDDELRDLVDCAVDQIPSSIYKFFIYASRLCDFLFRAYVYSV